MKKNIFVSQKSKPLFTISKENTNIITEKEIIKHLKKLKKRNKLYDHLSDSITIYENI